MKKGIVKNRKFNTLKTKINKLDRKIPNATTLIQINQYNADKKSFEKKIVDVDKKIPSLSGLMTTTVLNSKIIAIKNKIPNVSDLVKKTDYDAKISEIEVKYITTSDYNKFTSDILDAKIKQKELVNKSDISNLLKNS